MARVVIECAHCGQPLSVPQKRGIVECPKCELDITLALKPSVVNTPTWLNKKFGFLLIFLAVWLQNNVMWFRINLSANRDVLEGLTSMLCFAGVMVVAFVDLVRNRGRLIGEQAYFSASGELPHITTDLNERRMVGAAPVFGIKFYIALVIPLLMIPIALMIPDMLDWCIHSAFRDCVEVSEGTYMFMLFLPFGTALLLMGMGYQQSTTHQNDVYFGARISAILTFAFFFLISFVMLTVSPY